MSDNKGYSNSETHSGNITLYWYGFFILVILGDLFIVNDFFLMSYDYSGSLFHSMMWPLLILMPFIFAIAAMYPLMKYITSWRRTRKKVPGKNISLTLFVFITLFLNSFIIFPGLTQNYLPSQAMPPYFNFFPDDNYILVNTSNHSWNPGSDIFRLNNEFDTIDEESGNYFLMLDFTFMVPDQKLDASKLRVFINNWNGPDTQSTYPEELVFTNYRKFTPGMWVLHTVDRDNLVILVWPTNDIFPGDQYEITIITPDGTSFVTKGSVQERPIMRPSKTPSRR
jgi:hypothetical protein